MVCVAPFPRSISGPLLGEKAITSSKRKGTVSAHKPSEPARGCTHLKNKNLKSPSPHRPGSKEPKKYVDTGEVIIRPEMGLQAMMPSHWAIPRWRLERLVYTKRLWPCFTALSSRQTQRPCRHIRKMDHQADPHEGGAASIPRVWRSLFSFPSQNKPASACQPLLYRCGVTGCRKSHFKLQSAKRRSDQNATANTNTENLQLRACKSWPSPFEPWVDKQGSDRPTYLHGCRRRCR